MNFNEIADLIAQVECWPYQFEFLCHTCSNLYGGTTECVANNGSGHAWYLRARLLRKDIITSEVDYGYGGEYLILPHMCTSEVVKKCFSAALAFAEHEVRESFKFMGKRVLGPHIAVEALATVANKVDVRGKEPTSERA